MSKTTFMLCRTALIIAGCFGVVWAALSKNYILLPFIIVAWGGLLFFLSRRVKEVLKDERSERIQEKAARITVLVFAIIAYTVGAVLVLVGGGGISSDLTQIGLTISTSAFAMLVIYWIIYFYYWRKY